jgi:hypothetical protein
LTYLPTSTVFYDHLRPFDPECTTQFSVPDHPEIEFTIGFQRDASIAHRLEMVVLRAPLEYAGMRIGIRWRDRAAGEDHAGDQSVVEATVGEIRVRARAA